MNAAVHDVNGLAFSDEATALEAEVAGIGDDAAHALELETPLQER